MRPGELKKFKYEFKWKVKKHLAKRRRLRKYKSSTFWYAKLYSMGERQFRFVEENEKLGIKPVKL